MNFRLLALLTTLSLSACATVITPENFKPRKPSISPEKSPISDTSGYSLRQSDIRMSGSTTKGNWEMGDYFGTWSIKGSSTDLLIRTVSSSKTTFTINGGTFPKPLSATCKERSHKSNWAFYKLKPNDLNYSCEFDNPDTKLELVLQDRNSALGALLNSRIGKVAHEGVELEMEEQVIEGPKYPTSSGNGYILRSFDKEVAGLDYREESDTFSSVSVPPNNFMIFLPPKEDPNHKAALIGAIALAFFDDPKHRENHDHDHDEDGSCID